MKIELPTCPIDRTGFENLLSFAAMIALLVNLVGCFRVVSSNPADTTTHGTIGWYTRDTVTSIPGVDQAIMEWHERGDELVFVVWTDLEGDTYAGGGGGSATPDEVEYDFSLRNDAKTFGFNYHKGKNVDGIVIDDVNYPLEKGRLILVSTQDDHPRVKQLRLDPTIQGLFKNDKKPDELRQELRDVAKANVEINEFFAESKAPR